MIVSQEFLQQCHQKNWPRSTVLQKSELYESDTLYDSEEFYVSLLNLYFGKGWDNVQGGLLDDLLALDDTGTTRVRVLSRKFEGDYTEMEAFVISAFLREFYLLCQLKNPQKTFGLSENTPLHAGVYTPTLDRSRYMLDKISELIQHFSVFNRTLLYTFNKSINYKLKHLYVNLVQKPGDYLGNHNCLGLVQDPDHGEFSRSYVSTVTRYYGQPDFSAMAHVGVIPGKIITFAKLKPSHHEFFIYYP